MNDRGILVYVSTDALLIPSDSPDHVLDVGISDYAKPFMHWCSSNYRTYLITDMPVAHAKYLLNKLELRENAVIIKFCGTLKTDCIEPSRNTFLIDDALVPGEVSWFLEHGLQDQLIGVDPHTGVSPATRQTLEARTRHGK